MLSITDRNIIIEASGDNRIKFGFLDNGVDRVVTDMQLRFVVQPAFELRPTAISATELELHVSPDDAGRIGKKARNWQLIWDVNSGESLVIDYGTIQVRPEAF